jgi:hypothetical protein
MLRYRLAVLRARLLQLYYDIQNYDNLPFQLINHDFEDRRIIVPVPPRPPQKFK